ncbi:transporter [Mesorhizobium xinjiangense]|uniref:transporter n=1 Tax=Mesorhizobium xinjiangense TaxID=2678685 RepID=UPI0012EE0675|nr:transporter [Mesorhizobium xinjiangense]
MPPAEDIQRYLTGVWRMMMGRNEGLSLLDISADGFWTSFFAIVLALPALLLRWITLGNDLSGPDEGTFSLMLRLGLIDLCVWVLPLIALMLIGPRAGFGDRIVHCVVSINWSSAILVWIALPPIIVLALWPDALDIAVLLSLVVYLLTIFLTWRLLNIALAKGGAFAAGVLAGLVIGGLFIQFLMQDMFGIAAQ